MQQLKLKSTMRLFHIENMTIINKADKSYRFEDSNELIYFVLDMLQNPTTIENLFNKVKNKYTEVSMDILLDIIRQLDELSFLEDCNYKYSKTISSYYEERYSRNIDFLGLFCKIKDNKYELQEKILSTKVALFGLGGVGSHVLLDLVSMGFVNVKALDFDKIELSNLNRQILYNEDSIGLSKIQVAKETINKYSKHNKVMFEDGYIDNVDKVIDFVTGYDIAIVCVDRPSHVVSIINEGCVKANVPFIGGGVDSSRTLTYSVLPHITGCIQCWQTTVKNKSIIEEKINAAELERDVLKLPMRPAVVNLVAIQAGMILSELVKFTIGLPLSSVNKVIQFDFETLQTSIAENWERDPDCCVCGVKEN